jgi:hypothetical protein
MRNCKSRCNIEKLFIRISKRTRILKFRAICKGKLKNLMVGCVLGAKSSVRRVNRQRAEVLVYSLRLALVAPIFTRPFYGSQLQQHPLSFASKTMKEEESATAITSSPTSKGSPAPNRHSCHSRHSLVLTSDQMHRHCRASSRLESCHCHSSAPLLA